MDAAPQATGGYGITEQVRAINVAGGKTKRRRSVPKVSQVRAQSVAGLQKTLDLRRFVFP